ncbi:unnamed protein product [Sympodiomycopsis kandeliae]
MILYHTSWGANFCSAGYLATPALSMLGLICAEVICVIRVWSIHKRQRAVLFILSTLLAGMVGVQIVSIYEYSSHIRRTDGTCITSGEPLWLAAFWIAPAILDTIMLLFSIAAVVHETRTYGYNRLLAIILRDQVAYFVLVAAACLTTATMMTSHASFIDSLNNPPAIVVSSIAATRIVLSLKAESISPPANQTNGHLGGSNNLFGRHIMSMQRGDQDRGVTIKAGPNERSWFHIRPKTTSTIGKGDGSSSFFHSSPQAGKSTLRSDHGESCSESDKDLVEQISSRSDFPDLEMGHIQAYASSNENLGDETVSEMAQSQSHHIDMRPVTQQSAHQDTFTSRRVKDIKGRAHATRGHTAGSVSLASQFNISRPNTGNSRPNTAESHHPYKHYEAGRQSPASNPSQQNSPSDGFTNYTGGAELSTAMSSGGRASPPPFSNSIAPEEAIDPQESQHLENQEHYTVSGPAAALRTGGAAPSGYPGGVLMFTANVTTVEEEDDDINTRPSAETITPVKRNGS